MSRLIQLFVLIGALIPALLQSQVQTASKVGVGSIVRIGPVKGKAMTGTIYESTPDSLTIFVRIGRESIEQRISRNDIQTMQVRAGKNRVAGAFTKGAVGLIVGAFAGGILGYVTYNDTSEGICIFVCDKGGAAAFAAVGVGGIGLIGGTIYGAATGVDRWITVPRR